MAPSKAKNISTKSKTPTMYTSTFMFHIGISSRFLNTRGTRRFLGMFTKTS
jgi:hypothetical protein